MHNRQHARPAARRLQLRRRGEIAWSRRSFGSWPQSRSGWRSRACPRRPCTSGSATTSSRTGINELDVSAKRVIALTEARLGRVDRGARRARGARRHSCTGADRDAMHEMSFRVVAGQGGLARRSRRRHRVHQSGAAVRAAAGASPPIESAHSDIVIEVIRLGERKDNAVRIRRDIADGSWLAALVPADLLIPRMSPNRRPGRRQCDARQRDGTVIGERSAQRARERRRSRTADARSSSPRTSASSSRPRCRARASLAGHADLVMMATLGTGSERALILALVAFGPWRARDNPVAELARAIHNGELVALLPADRRSDDRARRERRGAGALAQARRHAGAAGAVHSARRVERTDRRADARADAARVRGGRRGDRRAAAFQGRLQSVGAAFRRRGDRRGCARRSSAARRSRSSQVLLEVTERQPLDNLTMARRVIAALQGLGVHVGIDDLGTGHSGLSYMLKLGVDFIKIDKMFVDAIGTERYSTTIIETLVDLGARHADGDHRRGRRDLRAGAAPARARHPQGAGLRVRAAAARVRRSCNCSKPPIRRRPASADAADDSRPAVPRSREPKAAPGSPASAEFDADRRRNLGFPRLPAGIAVISPQLASYCVTRPSRTARSGSGSCAVFKRAARGLDRWTMSATAPACAADRGRIDRARRRFAPPQARSERPVTPPDSYRVVMENERVRMIEIHIKPHSKVNVDSPPGRERFLYMLSDGALILAASRQDAIRVRPACRRDRGVSGRVSDGRERHRLGRCAP